ncbi:cell division protein [Bifidobacterium sp. 81T8]|nr:cell division protein [Bifidobacterium simiiventris]MBW3079279.1 cell division protein [Bifidobacterium simiiventris]
MPQTTDQPSQTADAHEAAQSDAPTGYDLGATQPHQTIPSATQPATPVAPSASPSAPQSSSRRPFPIDALPDLREPSAGGNDDLDPADAQSRDEFTTVYDIIDQMEAALSEAKGSLFTPGLVKVDRDEFGGQLDELKKMLPVQLERASALMREAERRLESAQTQANAIVASAQSRAADMIKDANDQAQFLAGQENVTEIARQKARAILDQAQAKANRLTQGADKYCTTVMEGLQAQLGKLDRDVQAGLNVLYERQRTAGEQLPHLDNNDYPES